MWHKGIPAHNFPEKSARNESINGLWMLQRLAHELEIDFKGLSFHVFIFKEVVQLSLCGAMS